VNRKLASLLLILLIQCVLVAAVYWPVSGEQEKSIEAMAPFDRNSVTEVYVGDEFDNETALKRVGDRWFLPELEGLPADTSMVDKLLDAITSGANNWPIADSVAARQRFRVASYHYRRRINLLAGEQELGTFLLGASPGYGKIYARNQSQVAIYSIPFNAHDAPGISGPWLDRKLLQIRSPLRISADAYSLRLEAEHWVSGMGGTPDERELQALLASLRGLQIDGLASEDDQRDLAEAEAEMVFTIDSLAGTVTLELFRMGDRHFIHSSEYPLFFSLSAYDFDRLAGIDEQLISGVQND
jgi:uncharacterized membrane protein